MTVDAKNKAYHHECADSLEKIVVVKRELDAVEKSERDRDPNCDPLGGEMAQFLLIKYRRLNSLALSKLDVSDRFRLMFNKTE